MWAKHMIVVGMFQLEYDLDLDLNNLYYKTHLMEKLDGIID